MKKTLSMLLILLMVSTSIIPAFAENETNIEIEENVYAMLNAEGTTDKIIVSSHVLGHSGGLMNIKTALTNVQPLMDDLKINDKDGDLSLESEKSELYFTGNTTKALPVTTNIEYYLDEKKMAPKDLVGKSGHLKIHIKQENTSMVEVKNETGKASFFLPFETAIVTNLSNEIFSNVSVSSGKIIDDGHLKIVSAILSPGFKENFDLLESEIIVDELVIEADVVNLEINSFYMTTLCKLPEIDFESLSGDYTDVFGKVDDFQAASTKLAKGSNELEQYTEVYFGKQSEALNGFDTYLNKNQLLLNSILQFNGGITAFNQGFNLYSAGVLEMIQGINQLAEASTGVNAGLKSFKSQLAQVMPESENTKALYQGFDQILAGMNQLNQGLLSAQSSGQTLKESTALLQASNDKIAANNLKIKEGVTQLLGAQLQITPVINQLKEGGKAYSEGVVNLNSGMQQFKTEGVDSLISEIETALVKVEVFKERYNILKNISDDYNSFSGLNNNFSGSVVFILKTESIK